MIQWILIEYFFNRRSSTYSMLPKWCPDGSVKSQNISLLHGDIMSRISEIPDGSINLIVTSPPYGIGKEYELEKNLDDPEIYVEWCKEWINECHRVLAPNGTFILNVGTKPYSGRAKQVPIPYLLWPALSDFFLIQEIVWHYGAGAAGRKYLSQRNEKFLWLVKNENDYTFNLDDIRDPNVKYPNQKKNGKLRCNPNGKNPSDVWIIKKVTSGKNRSSVERESHPAQFPEEVIERCILGMSNKNDIVLDPFVGSGTTAKVCSDNDRFCIGIDESYDYLTTSAKRLGLSILPLDLKSD
jgi:adenine-specific DNA-methyltransferase